MEQRVLRILGTRGIPAAHGGFETFAERLALYLVARGWRVVVYGQDEGQAALREDRWQGIERAGIRVSDGGSDRAADAVERACEWRDACECDWYGAEQ